jgi:gamma-glutamyl-gamma-aminobutyrate hydrolase PuuD
MKTNKKLIGIPAWSLGENSFGVQKAYLEYFSNFGQVEILTPNSNIREDLDLVILPGGADTMSYNYNQPPGFTNSMSDPYKDYFAKVNLPQYINAGIPVFGICLGMQQLAIHFNVPLIQNISATHGYSGDKDKEDVNTCKVNFSLINKLFHDFTTISFKGIYKVNSYHHQGVTLESLSKNTDLIPLLVMKDTEFTISGEEYTLVEAFMHKELDIIAVQYHPERMSCDEFSNAAIKYLLSRKSVKYKTVQTLESFN